MRAALCSAARDMQRSWPISFMKGSPFSNGRARASPSAEDSELKGNGRRAACIPAGRAGAKEHAGGRCDDERRRDRRLEVHGSGDVCGAEARGTYAYGADLTIVMSGRIELVRERKRFGEQQ